MPGYRFSRSFTNLDLRADVTGPSRPSTSLGYAEHRLPTIISGPDTSVTHARPRQRRPRPPLLSLLRKPSFSSWGRADHSATSPAESTISTSSFGSLGPHHRRSSSEGGHFAVLSGSGGRLSRMPWSPVSLPSLSVDEDPFAALPSPTRPGYHSGSSGQTGLERVPDSGWLDDISLEQVGSFEDELACALRNIGSTPKRRTPAADEHTFKSDDSSTAATAEPWVLQTAPPSTPWISVTPPAQVALSKSRFAATQDELLRSTVETRNANTEHAADPVGDLSGTPSASPLPAGLRSAETPLMSTPRDATLDQRNDLRTGLTPLLASLLALGEEEGRDLLEPVLLDWASDDDLTEESCFTLGSSSGSRHDSSGRTEDGEGSSSSSLMTPATPLSPRERLGKFTRSPGLSPSPGRVEFARATFHGLSTFSNVAIPHLASPSSTISTNESPTPPLRGSKVLAPQPLLGRPSRSSSLPFKTYTSPPSPLPAVGKENVAPGASHSSASRPTPPVKRRRGSANGQARLSTPIR